MKQTLLYRILENIWHHQVQSCEREYVFPLDTLWRKEDFEGRFCKAETFVESMNAFDEGVEDEGNEECDVNPSIDNSDSFTEKKEKSSIRSE